MTGQFAAGSSGEAILSGVAIMRQSEPHAETESGAVVSGSPEPGSQPLLTVTAVSFRYSKSGPVLFRDLDVVALPGTLTVIEGQNGSGKSTLLEICAGLRTPTAGHVERPETISYLPQAATTLQEHLTGAEHTDLFGVACGLSSPQARARVTDTLRALHFKTEDLATTVGKLSGGSRQKLNLALALMDARAPLLLLDEPYAGFDAASLLAMMDQFDALLERGKAIVMVNHLTDPRLRIDHTVQVGKP